MGKGPDDAIIFAERSAGSFAPHHLWRRILRRRDIFTASEVAISTKHAAVTFSTNVPYLTLYYPPLPYFRFPYSLVPRCPCRL